MAARRSRWKKVIPTVTLTACSFTVCGQTAQAFFPPWWPTQTSPPAVVQSPPVTPPITVVPPTPPPPFSPPPITVPPTSPPPIIVPPTSPPPPCDCTCEHTTPEPSSLVAGIAGLATAAGWAARRRKKAL